MSRTPADENVARCSNCGGWMIRYNGCHLCRTITNESLGITNWNRK